MDRDLSRHHLTFQSNPFPLLVTLNSKHLLSLYSTTFLEKPPTALNWSDGPSSAALIY